MSADASVSGSPSRLLAWQCPWMTETFLTMATAIAAKQRVSSATPRDQQDTTVNDTSRPVENLCAIGLLATVPPGTCHGTSAEGSHNPQKVTSKSSRPDSLYCG